MKKRTTVLFIIIFFFILNAQKSLTQENPQDFDFDQFQRKFEIVLWLCEYDHIAWITTDAIIAHEKEKVENLGSEWFCFKDKNERWHAVYGKYENGSYQQILHYVVGERNEVIKTDEILSDEIVMPRVCAIYIALQRCQELGLGEISFNSFIRELKTGELELWLLPAFQSDNQCLYGMEFFFKFDKSGNQILESKKKSIGGLRGFKPDKEKDIQLDFTSFEQPTIGGIFFVWYYKEYFKSISMVTKRYISTVFYNSDSKEWLWIHAIRESEK